MDCIIRQRPLTKAHIRIPMGILRFLSASYSSSHPYLTHGHDSSIRVRCSDRSPQPATRWPSVGLMKPYQYMQGSHRPLRSYRGCGGQDCVQSETPHVSISCFAIHYLRFKYPMDFGGWLIEHRQRTAAASIYLHWTAEVIKSEFDKSRLFFSPNQASHGFVQSTAQSPRPF